MDVTCNACGCHGGKIKDGKNGTMSIVCPDCGSLTLVKSPKAVESLRARMKGGEAPAPAAGAKKGWADDILTGL